MPETQPLVSRAVWLREQERYDEAIALLRQAVANGEDEAPKILALSLMETNQYPVAQQVLEDAVNAGRSDLANLLGDVASQLGDVVVADAAYQRAVASGDPQALNDYSSFLRAEERYDEAIELLHRAMEANDSLAHSNMVYLYAEDLEDLDTALRLGERYLSVSKPSTYPALADVYERLDRLDEAERLYQRAIELKAPRAHCYYGWFLRDFREDYPRAEEQFRLAAADDEKGWGINLGDILLCQDREDEARKILTYAASWGDLDAQDLLDELDEDVVSP